MLDITPYPDEALYVCSDEYIMLKGGSTVRSRRSVWLVKTLRKARMSHADSERAGLEPRRYDVSRIICHVQLSALFVATMCAESWTQTLRLRRFGGAEVKLPGLETGLFRNLMVGVVSALFFINIPALPEFQKQK